jgi:hypothetical protein
MKTKPGSLLLLTGLLLIVISCQKSFSQDSTSQKSQMLDLKLQLLDSKLELLDTKIKLWEAKPKELDIKLNELDSKITSMDFDPQSMTKKVNRLDSLYKRSLERVRNVEIQPQVVSATEPKFTYNCKSAIMMDPVRLLEGTFYLSYERILNSRFSVNVGGMATYSTTRGLSKNYFSNQSFSYFATATNDYRSYDGEVMSGGGVNVQFRNYLLANQPKRSKAPLGLYAAPQLMYRKVVITGHYKEMEEVVPGKPELVEKKVNQHLNIFAGGVILGLKIPLFNVLTVDLFAGGNIRLSKYTNEDGFTKYKDWMNFDFSGVSPVAGIAIGILK